jgi:hypothetical protein
MVWQRNGAAVLILFGARIAPPPVISAHDRCLFEGTRL